MNGGKKELFQKWYWGKGVMIGKKKERDTLQRTPINF